MFYVKMVYLNGHDFLNENRFLIERDIKETIDSSRIPVTSLPTHQPYDPFIRLARFALLLPPLRSRAFLFVTACEKEIGFWLIEVFERFFNPKENGHLETGGLSCNAESLVKCSDKR